MSNEHQRVAVVTGASSGIGKETAKALAAQGWQVIAVGRNPERSAAAEQEIIAAVDGNKGGKEAEKKVTMIIADLALMAEADRVATEVAALTDRVDVLVNNAGGMAKEKVITKEGLEESFAGNHLGPFLLTNKLLPLLRNAAALMPAGSVRIINTSSDGSEMIKGLPWDDLLNLENYSVGAAYCNSKLANVLFARGLAKRFGSEGIIAHSMHPGTVDSNFVSHTDESTQAYINSLESISSEQGADTLIWLATAKEAAESNGGYFYLRKPRVPNPLVDDDEAVERLWLESEKIIAKCEF